MDLQEVFVKLVWLIKSKLVSLFLSSQISCHWLVNCIILILFSSLLNFSSLSINLGFSLLSSISGFGNFLSFISNILTRGIEELTPSGKARGYAVFREHIPELRTHLLFNLISVLSGLFLCFRDKFLISL